jgi:hypothetical protein
MKDHFPGISIKHALILLLPLIPAFAQKVDSFKINGQMYSSIAYAVPKPPRWNAGIFDVSADYNALSVSFYKVYLIAQPGNSNLQVAVAGNVAGLSPARYATIGYVLRYWKDGRTERMAVDSGWYKIVDPLLDCAEAGSASCCGYIPKTAGSNDSMKVCGPPWAMENQYDWRQEPKQTITLGNLKDSTRYYFRVYPWVINPVNIPKTITDGYYSLANYPPRYDQLRRSQAMPQIVTNMWIIEGSFISGKAPPRPTAGGRMIPK